MSSDFKGIKSLRLEDSITHLWITLYIYLFIIFYNRWLKTIYVPVV